VLARASLKVDGTLGIVFLWDGTLRVATKRRLDSEQACWAQAWLQKGGAATTVLEAGWTYLFEIVYADNALVVEYAFEGLVLLGACAPDGRFLGGDELVRLAARLRIAVVPQLYGHVSDLSASLGRLAVGKDFFVPRALSPS
jgi:hypothetical protein